VRYKVVKVQVIFFLRSVYHYLLTMKTNNKNIKYGTTSFFKSEGLTVRNGQQLITSHLHYSIFIKLDLVHFQPNERASRIAKSSRWWSGSLGINETRISRDSLGRHSMIVGNTKMKRICSRIRIVLCLWSISRITSSYERIKHNGLGRVKKEREKMNRDNCNNRRQEIIIIVFH